ncbi:MAG: alpha-2-macroglobulin family protein, partial [Bryobacteraceae bacterium]
WVSGGASIWGGERGERVQIIPDKKSYKAGDVARVLILANAPGAYVLVTSEGRDLYTRQVVKADKSSVLVNIPIKPEYAPNFFINATFVQDGQLRQGSKNITVPASGQQLKVEVQTAKPEYKPGEPAVYSITTRDNEGKPIAAEVSIGVVDEAIYAIRPESAPDIFKSFYGKTYNRVNTDSSLNYYFQGEAGKRRMQLTGIRNRRNLAQLKPEALVQPKVRKAFPDTAYWMASLMTDANGRATAKFDFPDALTSWRATARGVTRDTKVGSTVQQTIVRKNLMLRIAAPRFFTHGDEVTLSVLVHNYLKKEKRARVSLDTVGLEIIDGAPRDVTIASGAEAKLDWRVRVKSASEITLLGKALTDEESDAMELKMPGIPYGVKLSMAQAGSVHAPQGQQPVELTFPPSAIPSSRVLEISVAPSVAGTIFGALEYLTTFPYGCTEQTMSSFLPNIVVTQALKELNITTKVDRTLLEKKVKAGMDRLFDFQHEDGGWGWWKTDESDLFLTTYVISGLAQARAAGYTVKPEALNNGTN